MKKTWELWKDETLEGVDYSFFPEDNHSARKLLTSTAKLIWKIEAENHEEAMGLKNSFLNLDRNSAIKRES